MSKLFTEKVDVLLDKIVTTFTLRHYQKEVLKSIIKSFNRGIQRQLGVLFTGGGKTIVDVFLAILFLMKNKNVLILVDQTDLVWQWKKRIHNVDDSINVQIEKAEHTANRKASVCIATVQTLGRKGSKRIKKFNPDHFDLCIVDEAHKSITETWIRVLEYFGFGKDNLSDGNLLYGNTATPYRSSGESMGILYDDIVANYDIRYGIANGWLTDIELYDVDTDTDLSEVDSYKDDFNLKQLSEAVDNDLRNEEVVKAHADIAGNSQSIVYTASVDHAYHLRELFVTNGFTAEVIEANTDKSDRKDWMQDFEEGRIDVLLNYNTLSVGIDFPELSTIIFARPIKSKLLFTQILGRVLRPSQSAFVDSFDGAEKRKEAISLSAKPTAKVVDFYDEAGNHNLAHVPSLFGLHNELRPKKQQQFFKEVVEPLEEKQKETGIDISKVKDLDEVELLVKNRKVDVKKYKPDETIEQFTNRRWLDIGNGNYEIIYSEEGKTLIIEKDKTKQELVDKDEYKLLEYDKKTDTTKHLQTFNSLGGAFKIGDEYAERSGWETKLATRGEWVGKGVTEKQLEMFQKFFKYKSGYKKYRLLNDRYEDTEIRKVYWKPSGETLDRGSASAILDEFFNNH